MQMVRAVEDDGFKGQLRQGEMNMRTTHTGSSLDRFGFMGT